LLEFVQTLARVCPLEYELIPFPAEAAAIDIGDYTGNYSRFNAAAGWQPTIDIEDGLRRTIEFFRDRDATRSTR
jgi:nucleoside-diphosphate-sugar epimerase